MKEVKINIDFASDGSGWAKGGIHSDAELRKAFLVSEMENRNVLLVPPKGNESELFERQIEARGPIVGIKVPNVLDSAFEEV